MRYKNFSEIKKIYFLNMHFKDPHGVAFFVVVDILQKYKI